MFANGDDAKNFITNKQEFVAAFNRFAICSFISGATVLSASAEDSHPHSLLYGTYEKCYRFSRLYENLSIRSISRKRGSADGVQLHCELYEITDEQYLMNVAAYTIIQATKDGKAIMPYDYIFGTGSLYFRPKNCILPWMISDDGTVSSPVKIGTLTQRERIRICSSKIILPEDWLVCNDFILPTNYVDIARYEQIFKTHNCFRVFLSSPKSRDQEVLARMAQARGVMIEDLEARKIYQIECQELFHNTTPRFMTNDQRVFLAQTLKKKYNLSYRQLSFLTKINESDLRKIVK